MASAEDVMSVQRRIEALEARHYKLEQNVSDSKTEFEDKVMKQFAEERNALEGTRMITERELNTQKGDLSIMKDMVEASVAELNKQNVELNKHRIAIERSHDQATQSIDKNRQEAVASVETVIQSVNNMNLEARIQWLEANNGAGQILNVQQRIHDMELKIKAMQEAAEARGGGGFGDRGAGDHGYNGYGGGRRGYLPQKSTIPKQFAHKPEEWRQWKADILRYLDTANNGMKNYLEEWEALDDEPEQAWLWRTEQQYGVKVVKDQVEVWRALKGLTDGEAEKVVESVGNENGWEAWRRLCRHFEPSVKAKAGRVVADFGEMVKHPAKNLSETRRLVTVMDEKMKIIHEITGETVPPMYAKAVLDNILDPVTKLHTAGMVQQREDFKTYKEAIIKFINNASSGDSGGSSPMQIGAVKNPEEPSEPPSEPTEPWDPWNPNATDCQTCGADDPQLWAIKGKSGGKGASVRCHACGMFGHMWRNCRNVPGGAGGKAGGKFGGGLKGSGGGFKGSGKSGGGFKGSGGGLKGSGKSYGPSGGWPGPAGGCFHCGGPHLKRDCPQLQGQARPIEQARGLWPQEAQPAAQKLSCMVEVKNAFEALTDPDDTSPETYVQESGEHAASPLMSQAKAKLLKKEQCKEEEFDTILDAEQWPELIGKDAGWRIAGRQKKLGIPRKLPKDKEKIVTTNPGIKTKDKDAKNSYKIEESKEGLESKENKEKVSKSLGSPEEVMKESNTRKSEESFEEFLERKLKEAEDKLDEIRNLAEKSPETPIQDLRDLVLGKASWHRATRAAAAVIEKESLQDANLMDVKEIQGKWRFRWTRKKDTMKEGEEGKKGEESLNPLQTIYPDGVNGLKDDDGWEEVTLYVDSGATETVIGQDMITSVELKEGVAYKNGVSYEVANGIRIPNLGERNFTGETIEGGSKNITAQVCAVNKALLSVSKAVKAGNRVVFDDDAEGSYIESKSTGERTWLVEENGMYALKMWIKKPF